ncbi:MAG: sulfotransferase domain-containing protein [Candidatus Korobacteraceae bacterium]
MDSLDGNEVHEQAGMKDRVENPAPSQLQQRAVWIASYPKSGNTWIRVFLHNLLRELRGQTEGAQDINALHEMTARESLKVWFERRLGKPAHKASAAEIAEARGLVQADMVRAANGPVYIKTHNAVATVEGFPAINFDVTLAAIYIVRNPLDVAVSYAHYSGVAIDAMIAHMADPVGSIDFSDRRVWELTSSWSTHAASWMAVPNRPILLLRYEDLLVAPERSFGRLASFLRLKPNADQLRRAIEKSSFAEMARQEELHGFNERPGSAEKFFRSGKAGQWREALSPAQAGAIVATHGPMMMRFGYLEEDCGDGGGGGLHALSQNVT